MPNVVTLPSRPFDIALSPGRPLDESPLENPSYTSLELELAPANLRLPFNDFAQTRRYGAALVIIGKMLQRESGIALNSALSPVEGRREMTRISRLTRDWFSYLRRR